MDGKKIKKRLNAKLHTLLDFSPEKEEPIMERKQKHKLALQAIHHNMQELPMKESNPCPSGPKYLSVDTMEEEDENSTPYSLEDCKATHSERSTPSKVNSRGQQGEHLKKISVKSADSNMKSKTPAKSAVGVCGDSQFKKSASKLSLSQRKKLPESSAQQPCQKPAAGQPVIKNLSASMGISSQNDAIDQLGKRLERLLSVDLKSSKAKPVKKKIKKTQKHYLEQSVMLSDSDGQMSDDCAIASKDSGKTSTAHKTVQNVKKATALATESLKECRDHGKKQANHNVSASTDSSFDDFKKPEVPITSKQLKDKEKPLVKGKSRQGKLCTKKEKTGKKKLRTLHEIDFSSSSDEDDLSPSAVSSSIQATKGAESSKPVDLNATVDMLTARLDSLLKKPPKKAAKKTKKNCDMSVPKTGCEKSTTEKEHQPSESVSCSGSQRNRSLSSHNDEVSPETGEDQCKLVKDSCLQVSLNSSKNSELSDDSVFNKTSTSQAAGDDISKQSLTSQDCEDTSGRPSTNSELSPQPAVKEISLQVSMSQSSEAGSVDNSTNEPNVSIPDISNGQEHPDSSAAEADDEDANQSHMSKESEMAMGDREFQQELAAAADDSKMRETHDVSSCSSDARDSVAPDESIYITPPDSKPSWESTAIGDALDVKFSDLNLHVSRISSESNKSRPSKSPEAPISKPSPQAAPDEGAVALATYVPDSDSDDSVASSNHHRYHSSSDKSSSPQDDTGKRSESSSMNESGPTVISDSEDDDFEKFLSVMKQKPEKHKQPSEHSGSNKSMEEFIVPDSEVESDEEDSMLHRKVDADNSVAWEEAEGRGNESDSKSEEEEEDSDAYISEDKGNSSSQESENDNDVFKSAVKTQKPRITFDDSSDDEDFKSGTQYFTPKVTLKKDRGIARDSDGVLFKTPMYVPKLKSSSSDTHHSPIIPVSRGGMMTYPSSVPAKCRTEAKRLEKRPQSAGGTENFLKSLSSDLPPHHRDHDAVKYVNSFKANRAELTRKLFTLYNETVFEKQMPANMEVIWNNRLNKTAGRCRSKRDRSAPNGRVSKIELSTKVCDSAERVRDTLIHEMCHAAVWLIHGEHGGHGPLWKAFALRASRIHTELPPISRCHAYDIAYKYIYKCTNCSYQFGRHSKSLDTDRKVCGHCRGRFELLVNAKTSSGETPRALRTPSKFALFVKENYGSVKKTNKDANHKDIMQLLSKQFSQTNLES